MGSLLLDKRLVARKQSLSLPTWLKMFAFNPRPSICPPIHPSISRSRVMRSLFRLTQQEVNYNLDIARKGPSQDSNHEPLNVRHTVHTHRVTPCNPITISKAFATSIYSQYTIEAHTRDVLRGHEAKCKVSLVYLTWRAFTNDWDQTINTSRPFPKHSIGAADKRGSCSPLAPGPVNVTYVY